MHFHPLIECVPNFSEGRDIGKVQAILKAILDGPDIFCLDQSMDSDHHRSVITFVGTETTVGEAALRAIQKAAELIDLNQHHGVHPRIGAADVVPFVPLTGSKLETCIHIAQWVAEQAWVRYGIPTYLYGAAARSLKRQNLEDIRRGGFEILRDEVQTHPERRNFWSPTILIWIRRTSLSPGQSLAGFALPTAGSGASKRWACRWLQGTWFRCP